MRSLTEKLREAKNKHSTEVAAIMHTYDALRNQVEDYHNNLFAVMDTVKVC